MEKFILSTDSCCDELKSNLKKNKIKYIAMSYICNEEVYDDNFDSLSEYENFYNEMRKGKVFSTTALNHFQLKEYFEKLLSENKKDILHISLSSGLSGTLQVTKDVAEETNLDSENKIYVLDSLAATQGQNFLLNYALKLRNEGKSAKESLEALEDISKKLTVNFFLSDLEALKRGGRISAAKAAMAKMLQLKPILGFDAEGKLDVFEKVLGAKKAIRTLAETYLQNVDEKYDMPIFIAFSGDPTNANELRTILEEKTGKKDIVIKPVGPVISSHTGPTLTGVIFISKKYRK